MNKEGKSATLSVLAIILAFIFGGTGLSTLFNAKGNSIAIVSGFALIGIAVAIIYKLLEK